ncbi:MAG: hypothetical protein M3Z04_12125 [Chloroflexota bacterium]|nr:hypothetical protein [Chloroflexota bacterium]
MDNAERRTQNAELAAGVDPAAALADLRAQIQARRARLGSDAVDGAAGGDFSLGQLRQSVDEVNDLWFVSAHLPITWRVPGLGTALAYAQKATRVLLRWYINPIVEQQNRFNSAVARALVETTAYQERLTREWQRLDERVLALERVAGGQGSGVRGQGSVVGRRSSVAGDEGLEAVGQGSTGADAATAPEQQP